MKKIDKKGEFGAKKAVKFGLGLMAFKKWMLIFFLILPAIVLVVVGLAFSTQNYDQNMVPIQEMCQVNNKYAATADVYAKRVNIKEIQKTHRVFPILDKTNNQNTIYFLGGWQVTYPGAGDRWNTTIPSEEDLGDDMIHSSSVVIYDNASYDDINVLPLYGELPKGEAQVAIPKALFDYMLQYGYYDFDTAQEVFFEGDSQAFWEHLQTIEFFADAGGPGGFQLGIYLKVVGVFDTYIQTKDYYSGISANYYDNSIDTIKYSLQDTQAFMPIVHYSLANKLHQLYIDSGLDGYQNDIDNPSQVLVEFSGDINIDSKFVKDFDFRVMSPSSDYYRLMNFVVDKTPNTMVIISVIFGIISILLISSFVIFSNQIQQETFGYPQVSWSKSKEHIWDNIQ